MKFDIWKRTADMLPMPSTFDEIFSKTNNLVMVRTDEEISMVEGYSLIYGHEVVIIKAGANTQMRPWHWQRDTIYFLFDPSKTTECLYGV